MLCVRNSARNIIMVGIAFVAFDAKPADAQVSTAYEQTYLPAGHNWAFRDNYPGADRLFNAFDYGHAILYEILWTRPTAPESVLEQDRYDFITGKLLVSPPRMPLEEAAIEVAYARLAPEAKQMFDWAHLLHRQIYDVFADESIEDVDRDARVAELLRYYKSRPDLAFSSKPKDMELMEGRYYSKEFRDRYPKFNGLIWAYHWLQVGLYEPLVTARSQAERQTGVTGAVKHFREMLENPPAAMPTVMPMTAAIAPEFTRRYPEAAIIFDNLHGMHDVISDILSSPKVSRRDKRKEILKAARLYRDDTSFVMTESGWMEMSVAMGIENMGGVAWTPKPTEVASAPEQPAPPIAPGMAIGEPHNEAVQQLLEAMFRDSVIRSRSEQDTTLVRLMREAEVDLSVIDEESVSDSVKAPANGHRHPTAPKPSSAARKMPVESKPAQPKPTVKKKPAMKPSSAAPKPVAKPPVHTGH
jgi:hypothetical protein